MTESLRIFRLEFPEERLTPRVVGTDEMPITNRGLRLTSSRELSAPLRRRIFIARQSIIDAQREGGEFHSFSPQGTAEFLLTAFWLGLQDDPSLAVVFSECVDLLLESQRPSGRWGAESVDLASLDTTLLVYLALKLFGVSPADETMVAARRSFFSAGGFAQISSLTRGYLALFGQLPFESEIKKLEGLLSLDEAISWRRLMQRKLTRQLAPADALVELRSIDQSNAGSPVLVTLAQQSVRGFQTLWNRLRNRLGRQRRFSEHFEHVDKPPSCRTILYEAMGSEGPLGGMGRSPKLQDIFERLKDPVEGVNSIASTDIAIQADCLEAVLLSGMPVVSPSIAKAAHVLCQSWRQRSHKDQTAVLRVAGLVQQAECQNEMLPPPLHVATGGGQSTVGFETEQQIDRLVGDIPKRVASLRATQQRTGSWEGCPLATARALLALATVGIDLKCKKMVDAVRFLRRTQLADGSWQSVQQHAQTVTTAAVVAAAQHVGLAPQDPLIERGSCYLLATQQVGGGWSEQGVGSDATDQNVSASLEVTAQVLNALIDCGYASVPAVAMGIDFLFESDLFSHDADSEGDHCVSLTNVCAMLGTLCRWASLENNREGRRNSVARSLTLLAIHD